MCSKKSNVCSEGAHQGALLNFVLDRTKSLARIDRIDHYELIFYSSNYSAQLQRRTTTNCHYCLIV